MAKPLKICVCGGGKTAHVMAALAASVPEMDVNVLTLYKDEAEQWNKAVEKDGMVLVYKLQDDSTREVKAKPNIISKDPAAVIPESDLVIFAVAANTHEEYLKAISGHLHKKMVVVGLPGLPGFEHLCRSYFGELDDQITIMSFEISPWICEIVEYGKKVEITRTAKSLNGSIVRGKAIPRKPALMSLQMLLGFDPALKQVKHFTELLFTTYTFFNPVLVYGQWKDWDGKPIDSEPYVYEHISQSSADLLELCSKEYQAVAHALSAKKPEVDLTTVPDIFNWLIDFYKNDIEDGTSLLKAITTNKAYKGVKHTMKKVQKRFMPDFECRFLIEDVPMGMAVVKGIAEILEVPTPTCDMIIEWAQDKLKKQYLVDGKLAGSDVNQTRAPQRFGFSTLDEILQVRKIEPIVYVKTEFATEDVSEVTNETANGNDQTKTNENTQSSDKTQKDKPETEKENAKGNENTLPAEVTKADENTSVSADPKANEKDKVDNDDKTNETPKAEENTKVATDSKVNEKDKTGKDAKPNVNAKVATGAKANEKDKTNKNVKVNETPRPSWLKQKR